MMGGAGFGDGVSIDILDASATVIPLVQTIDFPFGINHDIDPILHCG